MWLVQRRRRRAHRRPCKHGRSARDVLLGARRLRSALYPRRPATMSTISAGRFQGWPAYTIGFSPAAVVWHFPAEHGEGLYRPAEGLRQGRGRWSYGKHPFRFNLFGPGQMARPASTGDLSTSLLLSSRPVIYFGRVRPRPLPDDVRAAVLAPWRSLPLTFEWNHRRHSPGARRHRRRRLGCGSSTVPIPHHLGPSASTARSRAPIDKRFPQPQGACPHRVADLSPVRSCVAWKRAKWRIPPDEDDRPRCASGETEQEGADRLARGARCRSAIGATAATRRRCLLGGLIGVSSRRQKYYFIVPDQGLEPLGSQDRARGLWSRALLCWSAPRTTAAISGCCGFPLRHAPVASLRRFVLRAPGAVAAARPPLILDAAGGCGGDRRPRHRPFRGHRASGTAAFRRAHAPDHRGGGKAVAADPGRTDRPARHRDRPGQGCPRHGSVWGHRPHLPLSPPSPTRGEGMD